MGLRGYWDSIRLATRAVDQAKSRNSNDQGEYSNCRASIRDRWIRFGCYSDRCSDKDNEKDGRHGSYYLCTVVRAAAIVPFFDIARIITYSPHYCILPVSKRPPPSSLR